MKQFTDSKGKTWELSLTIGSCKRVKDVLNFDLLHPEKPSDPNDDESNGAYVDRIENDPFFILDMIKTICDESVEKNGYANLKQDKFYDLFDGQAFQDATSAFQAEYEDFFLRIGKPAQNKYLKMAWQIKQTKEDLLAARFSEIDLKKLIEEELEKVISGEQSGDGQEKLESTQEG